MIRLIRPFDHSAEKEMIKEFFRLIGCLFTEVVVERNSETSWFRKLEPISQDNVIDIVLNYYGYDLYEEACTRWGIRRLYCYTDFTEKKYLVTSSPILSIKEDEPRINKDGFVSCSTKKEMRHGILAALIASIWKDCPKEISQIQNILNLYSHNIHGDLFYILQAKRCFRVLDMAEVLNEPSARVPFISMQENPYVERMLSAMWEMRTELDELDDSYSIHAQADIDCMIREITARLQKNERFSLSDKISHNHVEFWEVPASVSIEKMRDCILRQPEHLQNYLMLSCLCHSVGQYSMAEQCLKHVLRSVPQKTQGYAFVPYRLARFYEKIYNDKRRAEEFYRLSLEWNPENYQAMFKLALFAAEDQQMERAERILKNVVDTISHRRGTDDNNIRNNQVWDRLTLKESQYLFKAFILLARIAVNGERVNGSAVLIGRACLAATSFCDAKIIKRLSDQDSFFADAEAFFQNQRYGKSSWSMWKVLQLWSDYIVRDDFVQHVVDERLQEIGIHAMRRTTKKAREQT